MPRHIVSIVDHRSEWTDDFDRIATHLAMTLGSRALRLDHIGSTAVPGLAAKDIIDVQVTVALLDDAICNTLLSAGYTTHQQPPRHDHVPPGFEASAAEDWEKLFFMQRQGTRRSNVHVRQAGRPNQRYALLVRDYLRVDHTVAQAYGELKKRLATSLREPDDYAEVKDPASDIIYAAAERWALQVGWTLPAPARLGET